MPTKKTDQRTRRGYGAIRKLPSGRYQASHLGPDGARYKAPHTFDTKDDADAWLAAQRTDISRGEWEKPVPVRKAHSFGDYAETWLATRTLTAGTRAGYRRILTRHLNPTFGETKLDDITPAGVRAWHAGLAKVTGPTRRAHAYGLLHAILATAVEDDAIDSNPCRVKGAAKAKRARPIHPATLAELEVITEAMPDRWRLIVLLAAWCGLRFGEVAELRRKDVDLHAGVLRIRRAVTYVAGQGNIVGPPKTEAGIRDVAVPPDLLPDIRSHLLAHAQPGPEGLLFTAPRGGHIRMNSTLRRKWETAREQAGRPDLTYHDLRHTGATLAAAAGATVAELMARIGHSTPAMAMRYQHAGADRDRAIAKALSGFRTGGVVTLRPQRQDSAEEAGA